MLRSIKQLAGCIAALTVIGTGAANAQADCPRGDLDKTYCDRNGDLVADAPTDPKQEDVWAIEAEIDLSEPEAQEGPLLRLIRIGS